MPSRLFSTFYLSQRPYLVSGSLRDQILYPHPPAAVWAAARPQARAEFEQLPTALMSEDDRDARLEAAIEAVELDYLLGRLELLIQSERTGWTCRNFWKAVLHTQKVLLSFSV